MGRHQAVRTGLAAAVLLDAFLLPGWLDRILPHLSIEPSGPAGS